MLVAVTMENITSVPSERLVQISIPQIEVVTKALSIVIARTIPMERKGREIANLCYPQNVALRHRYFP